MTISCWKVIQHKPIHTAPPQLQQMLLCMQMYDYTIWYKPSKDVVLADQRKSLPFPWINSLPIPIGHNVQHVKLSKSELDIIWGSMEHDPVFSSVYHLTLRCWPKWRQEVSCIAILFWECQGWTVHQFSAYSSRGQESVFPQISSTAPLLICMEHIKVSTGCRPRQERQCIGLA